jgi:hypothetical protein
MVMIIITTTITTILITTTITIVHAGQAHPPYCPSPLLSIAANDAYQMTWCCIQRLCIHSGER